MKKSNIEINIGDAAEIDPEFEDIEMSWVTIENNQDKKTSHPAVWIIYKEHIYYGVCKYRLGREKFKCIILKNGEIFNEFEPGESEWDFLNKKGITYYRLDYEKFILQENFDKYCRFEIDFIKKWHRETKIDDAIQ